VNQQLPFVNASSCPGATTYLYEGYLTTCGGSHLAGTDSEGDLENPYGTSLEYAAPTNPKASDLANFLPNAAEIESYTQPISLGVYDRANKLPYTMNYTLDIQWQPRPDLAIEIGYVGNVGRHQVIPLPFNQPVIATPSNPTLSGGPNIQKYSYGYTVGGATLPDGTGYQANFEGGNVDLRVPYIGYAAESITYKAAGIDDYNALQVHIDKRMSHGLQVGASYTWSHALDEQSGLGLFYNGNNPLNLRSAYGSSDFDRTHVLNLNYAYQFHNFATKESFTGKFVDGWALVGLAVLQSGQPYSVIDFSGAVGSIYYSTADGITNPIVPLSGCTPKQALSGASGAWTGAGSVPALNASCFSLPLLPAGGLGGAIPTSDPYETGFTNGQRNIFRQAFQKRADVSLVKDTKLTERFNLKYTFDVYNVTNTTSFDIPGNEVSQNSEYNAFPYAGQPVDDGSDSSLYSFPSGLGIVTHTIGSPRQIQMSLHLDF
jgi:hypothetical protein